MNAGHLEDSKLYFDRSVNAVLGSGLDLSIHPELAEFFETLIEDIHAYEIVALQVGDGFSEQRYEPAPIDELGSLNLYPLMVDPKLKHFVEEDLANLHFDFPVLINDRVLTFLGYYQNRGRELMESSLRRSGRYLPMIQQVFSEERLPQDLAYLAHVESAFKPLAYSRARAKGIWQFISATGRKYGLKQNTWLDERSNPEKATRAAARYLKELYELFGDWYLALASYNCGEGKIQRVMDRTGVRDFWRLADRRVLPRETINYVPSVLAAILIAKNPARYGFDVQPEAPIQAETIAIPSQTSLSLVAEKAGISLEELKELNPELRRFVTPRNEYALRLPQGRAEAVQQALAMVPPSERVILRRHVVRAGETLSTIARRYRITVAELAEANELRSKHRVRLHQTLIIPIGSERVDLAGTRPQIARNATRSSYVVQSGDTLSGIAGQLRVGVGELKRWNGIRGNRIRPGQKLVVYSQKTASPSQDSAPKIVYRVRRGDTLSRIATRYNTTVDALLASNNRTSPRIHPGDQLTIYPGK